MRPWVALSIGTVLAAALVAGALASPASVQWKWRDRNGQITVSDLPPPRDIPERDILQRPDPAAVAATAAAATAAAAPAPQAPARARVAAELAARRRAAEQEQAAQQRAQAAQLAEQRAQNCRNARNHLAALESGQRLVRMNDKGEREFLDDKQRADETRRAREVIAADCG